MMRRLSVVTLVALAVALGAGAASVRGTVLRAADETVAATGPSTGDVHELSKMVDDASKNVAEFESRASASGSAEPTTASTQQLRDVLEAHIVSVQKELTATGDFVASEPAADVAERLARVTHEFIKHHLIRHAVGKADSAVEAAEDAKSMAQAAIKRSPTNAKLVEEEKEVIREADAAITSAEKVKSQTHVKESLTSFSDDELVASLKQVGDGLRSATTSGGNSGASSAGGGSGQCANVPRSCLTAALLKMQRNGELKSLMPGLYKQLGLGGLDSHLRREAMRQQRLAEIRQEEERRSRAVEAQRERAHQEMAERAMKRERELVAAAVATAVGRAREEAKAEASKMALEEQLESRKASAEARVRRDMERKAMVELRHKAAELEQAKEAAMEAEVAKSRAELEAEAEERSKEHDGSAAHAHADRAIKLARQAHTNADKAVDLAGGKEVVLAKAEKASTTATSASELATSVKEAVPAAVTA